MKREHTEFEIVPENLIPEAKEFVRKVNSKDLTDRDSAYGHAASFISGMLSSEARGGASPEKQREEMKRLAINAVIKHGEEIIPFLRDELQLAISDEDLEDLRKQSA